MKIWSNNSKGTRFPGVDYMKYETEFLKVKGRSFMNKFQIGDKVIVTAHKEDMEYPCISAKKKIFLIWLEQYVVFVPVGTMEVCLIKLHLKKILVDMIVMERVKMVMDRL